ncbi:LysR family transcriptional regulator [Sporomusa malonica]|uniref:DNA-binding transcriptional regulator, LysR family n=1 Tax=Sporomusa malonica TaxID=112901 RepID=A0A1W1ZSQ5_9FIRM|nr:LysR family transcriptional regulator [Sporomusa malonica]SMC51383.1 DNA-binding transcriptional regulator, LysR family [Sporomusa malonica]
MDLRQLEYFQMASRLKSISKAAEQLRVAQPSVSIAIQKLEEELGVLLFDRSQRQIQLTSEGLIFIQRVNEILTRLDDSVTEMNDLRLLQKGSIKIGIPPMIGAFLFPHIFSQFHRQFPLLELSAIEGGSLTIQKLVEQGKLDIGIITKSTTTAELDLLPITSGQIHVCLPPDHPFSSLQNIPFNQLSDQPFILLKEDTYIRQIITTECAKHQFTPQIVFVSSQIETIIGLVEQGAGIAFLFDAITRKHDTVQSRPLTNPIYFEIVLAWNHSRYLSNAARAFINFITSSFRPVN